MGFNENLRHLDNRLINVTKTGTSQPLELMKISGEGMPKFDNSLERGDLYIKILFNLPKSLSTDQKDLIKEIFE